MTLTTKDPRDLNSPGKPGASSHNSENKSGQSSRSNPVCLEVAITIRSLPTEAGALTQPIREEGRTVIVFDNGAVLRSTNNLPIGQTVILSNHNGRDVVCRVVGGRNLPSIKGYVEVEFLEPVNDFWGIHQDNEPGAGAPPPPSPPAPLEAQSEQSPVTPLTSSLWETPPKPTGESLGSGPSFDDIPGLLSKPLSLPALESKPEPTRPSSEKAAKEVSDYNLSAAASPTSVANWRPPAPEPPAEKRANSATMEATSTSPSGQSHDFLSKGLMAYEQPSSAPKAANIRTPLIVGAVALVLAGIGTQVFLRMHKAAPESGANPAVASQPPAPEAQTAKNEPQLSRVPQAEKTEAPAQTQTPAQNSAQPVAVGESQSSAAAAPMPAIVRNSATEDTRTESRLDERNLQPQDKKAAIPKQPNLSASRSPAIQNLKIGSPSAPTRSLATPAEGTAPLTDVASSMPGGGSTPSSLLTSAGRTSNPPLPPPSSLAPAPAAPAPVSASKMVTDAKLISSTRLSYPPTAKQSNVQGTVTLSATVDENGKVVSAKALSGPLLLRQAAVDSVKQWKYSPALIDGKPAPSQVTVNVEFKLN